LTNDDLSGIIMSEQNINLIQCGDHAWAPWSIVCTHLMDGTSREWEELNSNNPEVDFDWLCPECNKIFQSQMEADRDVSLEHLKAICIHCVRDLRSKFDSNYEKE